MYGKLISDTYDVISVQAQTQHSTVYLVRHKRLDMLRAAKVVRKDTPSYERILREADLMKGLRHSGIPLIYDIVEDSDSICIIEEFIYGKSLTEYVEECGFLKSVQIIDFVEQICNILEYLHNHDDRGIIHLDLKPDNIFITQSGNVKLIDFDNAVRIGEHSEECYGSIGFAAPEQYHRLYADCRADIYSLGILILYMDSGHIQCRAESLHYKKFYPIVKKCIYHNVLQRYSDIEQVKRAICKLKAAAVLSEKQKTQNIYLYGTKRGVGTTHIALCLTSFLTRKGFQAVYVQEADEKDFISEIRKGVLRADGTFLCKGIAVCPQYASAVQARLEAYDYIVHDCGVISDLPVAKDLKVVVTDFGYRRNEEFAALAASQTDSVVFVNHTDGQYFYEVLKQLKIKRTCYRIPCVYDMINGSRVLDDVFSEVMLSHFHNDFFKKKGGVRTVSGFLARKKVQKRCKSRAKV